MFSQRKSEVTAAVFDFNCLSEWSELAELVNFYGYKPDEVCKLILTAKLNNTQPNSNIPTNPIERHDWGIEQRVVKLKDAIFSLVDNYFGQYTLLDIQYKRNRIYIVVERGVFK